MTTKYMAMIPQTINQNDFNSVKCCPACNSKTFVKSIICNGKEIQITCKEHTHYIHFYDFGDKEHAAYYSTKSIRR